MSADEPRSPADDRLDEHLELLRTRRARRR